MKRTLAVLGRLATNATPILAQIGKPVDELVELELVTSSQVVEQQARVWVNVMVDADGGEPEVIAGLGVQRSAPR
jgi:hypothetical protein